MLENIKETLEILISLNTYKNSTLLSRADNAEMTYLIENYAETNREIEVLLKKLEGKTPLKELLIELRIACLDYTKYGNETTDFIKKVSNYYSDK